MLHGDIDRMRRSGRLSDAEDLCKRRLLQNPTDHALLHQLGMIIFQCGRRAEGLEIVRQSVRLAPGNAAYRSNLAGVLRSVGEDGEALEQLREATHLDANCPEALANLGLLLDHLHRSAEAVEVLQRAMTIAPHQPRIYSSLCLSLLHTDKLGEAEALARTAVHQWPTDAYAHNILGLVLLDLRRISEAIASFEHSLSLNPKCAETRANLVVALLTIGEWARGWREYEHRVSTKPHLRREGQRWRGEPLNGKAILLYEEGGAGSTIQFSRFATLLADLGASVVLELRPRLQRFLRSLRGPVQIIPLGAHKSTHYDFHSSLMSLPAILGVTPESLPARIPYLHPDEERVAHWQRELKGVTGLRIGISWEGNRRLVHRLNRSIPLKAFSALELPGVRLVSLQKNASVEVGANAVNLRELDHGGAFVDTAAVMKSLDLVVTCDTSIAHVAGAIGTPVWVALPFASDWTWLIEKNDSPWYPTMRLFRRDRFESWEDVFARIASEVSVSPPHR